MKNNKTKPIQTMNRLSYLLMMLACILVLPLSAQSDGDETPKKRSEVVQAMAVKPMDVAGTRARFTRYLNGSSDFGDRAKKEAAELVASAERDDADTLIDALAILYPDLDTVLGEVDSPQPQAGLAKKFQQLGALKKPWLTSHADFLLGRYQVEQGQYAEAIPLLDPIAKGERQEVLNVPEALFLLAVCHKEKMQRDQAMAACKALVKHFPNAPERLLVGAKQMMAELDLIVDGSMRDIADRMKHVGGRLEDGDTTKPTQEEQKHIVGLLDKLLEDMKKKSPP